MGIFILLIAGWLITPQTDAVIFRNGSNTIFAIKAQDSLVTASLYQVSGSFKSTGTLGQQMQSRCAVMRAYVLR